MFKLNKKKYPTIIIEYYLLFRALVYAYMLMDLTGLLHCNKLLIFGSKYLLGFIQGIMPNAPRCNVLL